MVRRRRCFHILLIGVVILSASTVKAQEVPREVASWKEDGRGNHRAVVEVVQPADAVRVRIPWRRRDPLSERCRLIAPPVPHVQPAAQFSLDESITVPVGKSWNTVG